MASHFLDTSALVKFYHTETGTQAVESIVNTRGNTAQISRLSVAELTSAFAIKVRTQAINREDADLFLRQFRNDVATGSLRSSLSANLNLR